MSDEDDGKAPEQMPDPGRRTEVEEEDRSYIRLPLRVRIKRTLYWMFGDETVIKWFTIIIGGLIAFGTTPMLKLQERIILAIIVMTLIYILWLVVLIPEEEPKVNQGWCITWIDKVGEMPFIRRENNLKLVFCNFIRYENGSVETVPFTEHYGVYTKLGVSTLKFNPMVNPEIIKYLEEEFEQKVEWADGTDSYQSPLQADERRIKQAIQSGTKQARIQTTKWLHPG